MGASNMTPYISFECRDSSGDYCVRDHIDIGECWRKKTIIVVRFNHMNNLGTIHCSLLENEVIDLKTLDKHKGFEVSWGEWIDKDACELIIKKIHKGAGYFKINIWADYDPNCVGIIEGI